MESQSRRLELLPGLACPTGPACPGLPPTVLPGAPPLDFVDFVEFEDFEGFEGFAGLAPVTAVGRGNVGLVVDDDDFDDLTVVSGHGPVPFQKPLDC